MQQFLIQANPSPIVDLGSLLGSNNPYANTPKNFCGQGGDLINCLGPTIHSVLIVIISLLIIVWIITAILAGFKYVTSQGDKSKLEEASTSLTNVLVGATLAIIFTALLFITAKLFITNF